MYLQGTKEWHDPLVQKTAALIDGQKKLEDNITLLEYLERTDCLSAETMCATMIYLCGWQELQDVYERRETFPFAARALIDVIYNGEVFEESAYFTSPLDAPLKVFLADKLEVMEDENPADFYTDDEDGDDEDDDNDRDYDGLDDDDDFDDDDEERGLSGAFNESAEDEDMDEEEAENRRENLQEGYKYLCQDMRDTCISLALSNRFTQLPPALVDAFCKGVIDLLDRIPDSESRSELSRTFDFVHKSLVTNFSKHIVRRAAANKYSPN